MAVLLETSFGDLVVDLFCDKTPKTANNFLKLCKMKYYNNNLFYSVEKDFIAQSGDPTATGNGGESVFQMLYGDNARYFEDEIRVDLRHAKKGLFCMANTGPNLNGSRFYITLRDNLDYLDDKHTIFGQVAEGMDIIDKINEAFVDKSFRPLKNIRIRHTRILDDPFPDFPQLIEPPSPECKRDKFDLDYLADEDEELLKEDTRPKDVIEKEAARKDAKTRAVVLEMIGDIPDADLKPPENILFVCKLHPSTNDEDLELIFSQFGAVFITYFLASYFRLKNVKLSEI